MIIGNLLSSYKSESPMRDTGWRSQELKNKAIELRLKLTPLKDIADKLFITSETAARWCREILGRDEAFIISKKVDLMSRQESKEQRKVKMVSLLNKNKSITVSQLSKKLNVSVVTIRKNLKEINHENI